MEETGDRHQVPITRQYRSEDRSRCVELAIEAWPGLTSGLPPEIREDFWGMLIDFADGYSDWKEVSCVDGEVVGFLFGRTRPPPSFREAIGLLRILIEPFRSMRKKAGTAATIALFSRNILEELNIILKTPESDGEVVFIVVGSGHRGRGIGRMLVDRFIEEAVRRNSKAISVFTTDPGCDWRFYEARGFERVASFDDDVGSRYSGAKTKGFIMMLRLGR